MKWLRKLWRWLRPGDVLYPSKEEIFKAVQNKTEQARQEVVKQFIRSVVDIKPGETVEIKPEGVVIKPSIHKSRPPVSLSDMYFEATQIVRDREIERAKCFGRIYRSTKNRDLAADVAKSIDRC